MSSGSWVGRHDIHRVAEAEADIPALVSPHHGPHLLLVLLQPVHRASKVVRRHELRGPLDYVHLLRLQGSQVRHLTKVSLIVINSITIRYRVPKIIAITITSLQLIQMIVGCAVNYLAFSYKQNGENNSSSSREILFILFINDTSIQECNAELVTPTWSSHFWCTAAISFSLLGNCNSFFSRPPDTRLLEVYIRHTHLLWRCHYTRKEIWE